MSSYDTYRATAMEAPGMRRWLFGGLVMSLLLHGALIVFFYGKRLENFGPTEVPRLAPPRFILKQATIDPKTLEEPEEVRLTLPDRIPNSAKIDVPQDKPQLEELRIAPQNPDLPKQIITEKPKVDMTGWNQMAKVEAASRGAMEKELNSMAGSLLKEGVKMPRQPVIRVPASNKIGDGGLGASDGVPGLKSLDEALAQTGPLPAGDAPIGMPGGALFEYDSFDLRPEAVEQLRKLGTLIQRNIGATFSIEGHSDSFGSPAYNQSLSEQRAESVKLWLVEIMAIPPDRIQTRGFGNTQPLVPSDRSKEEQAPNRRVEIVVKTNRARPAGR